MNGKEGRDWRQRCRLWDLLWEFRKFGAMSVDELCERARLRRDRVLNLLDHEWFTRRGGVVEIAKAHRNVLKINAA